MGQVGSVDKEWSLAECVSPLKICLFIISTLTEECVGGGIYIVWTYSEGPTGGRKAYQDHMLPCSEFDKELYEGAKYRLWTRVI